VRAAVVHAFARGLPDAHRTEQVDTYLARLAAIDPQSITPETMRAVFHADASASTRKE
jgi:malonate decarboxylase beta subunit